jgi:hypothetical protein
VKGRIDGADTVMITRQEVITSLHEPEKFILAIVQVENGLAREPRYVRRPFTQEPEFGVPAVWGWGTVSRQPRPTVSAVALTPSIRTSSPPIAASVPMATSPSPVQFPTVSTLSAGSSLTSETSSAVGTNSTGSSSV